MGERERNGNRHGSEKQRPQSHWFAVERMDGGGLMYILARDAVAALNQARQTQRANKASSTLPNIHELDREETKVLRDLLQTLPLDLQEKIKESKRVSGRLTLSDGTPLFAALAEKSMQL